jgi:hypothetical protein
LAMLPSLPCPTSKEAASGGRPRDGLAPTTGAVPSSRHGYRRRDKRQVPKARTRQRRSTQAMHLTPITGWWRRHARESSARPGRGS